ncbi:metallophosphoesterase [candidate division KSB1 bacterium]|nr:metallophosphoesterase [candidate division KSB1 bacterium]
MTGCKMKKIFLLLSLTVFISCADNQSDFTFVFMTDIHVQPELRATQGFQQAITRVNELNPEFVITGGDLVYDVLDETFDRADSLFTIYQTTIRLFNMPVYNTIGNHEVFGIRQKGGISPDHMQYGKKLYLDRLAQESTYYSFDHKGWHFMILDAIDFTPEQNYFGYIDSTQIAWIKKDLETVSPETPVVISLHIPLASVFAQMRQGATAALSETAVVSNSKEVMDLFSDHHLKLVLQGHLHIVEEIIYKDTHFITAGAVSGGWWKGSREGFPEGFARINVKGDDFDWSYETFGWQANPEHQ